MTGRPVRPDPDMGDIPLIKLILCCAPLVPFMWIMWTQLF